MTLFSIINEYVLIPFAHAAEPSNMTELMSRINQQIINPLLLVLFAVAFVQFTIGLYNFFGEKSGNEKSGFKGGLEQGKRHMLWGIVGMAIMVSVFGIMKFMTSTLGLDDVAKDLSKDGTGSVEVLTPNFDQ